MITTIERLKEIQAYYKKASQQLKDIQSLIDENLRPIYNRLYDRFFESYYSIQELEVRDDSVYFVLVEDLAFGGCHSDAYVIPIEALVSKKSLIEYFDNLQKKKDEEIKKAQQDAQDRKDKEEFERLKKKFGVVEVATLHVNKESKVCDRLLNEILKRIEDAKKDGKHFATLNSIGDYGNTGIRGVGMYLSNEVYVDLCSTLNKMGYGTRVNGIWHEVFWE